MFCRECHDKMIKKSQEALSDYWEGKGDITSTIVNKLSLWIGQPVISMS